IEIIKKLLTQSWPLMIVILSNAIFSRLDQLMIGTYINKESVGIYAAAGKILEIAATAPILIISSLFSAILNAKKVDQQQYVARIKTLNGSLFWSCLLLSTIIYIFSEKIISLLYTPAYLSASGVLEVICFNLIFIAM